MTSVAIYSTNYYFGAVQELPQAAPRLLASYVRRGIDTP